MAKGHAVEDGDEAARRKIVALPPCAASADVLPAQRPPVRYQPATLGSKGRVVGAKAYSLLCPLCVWLPCRGRACVCIPGAPMQTADIQGFYGAVADKEVSLACGRPCPTEHADEHTVWPCLQRPTRWSWSRQASASLKADESEGCSPVSSGRTIRLC
jgi:hypothetical protein